MTLFIVALAGVLIFEGLVLALAPSRIEDALRLLAGLPVSSRRTIGLAGLAGGVVLVWVATGFGG